MVGLTKAQIAWILDRVGQPRASVLLMDFFNSYRHCIRSTDVADLYDQAYFEKIASHPAHLSVAGRFKINIYNRHSYEYLAPRLTAASRVLDVGCGDGDFILALATHGLNRAMGVDFSERAIRTAQSKAHDAGLPVQFVCGDINELETDDAFHYAVLNDVTEHLSNVELNALFDKLKRLLLPGAQVVIHTPNGLALCNDTDVDWVQWLYRQYRRWRGWQGHERSVEQLYYDQVHINIKSYRQLKRFLNNLGYGSQVLYDERRRLSLLNRLSSNMLVIAWPRSDSIS